MNRAPTVRMLRNRWNMHYVTSSFPCTKEVTNSRVHAQGKRPGLWVCKTQIHCFERCCWKIWHWNLLIIHMQWRTLCTVCLYLVAAVSCWVVMACTGRELMYQLFGVQWDLATAASADCCGEGPCGFGELVEAKVASFEMIMAIKILPCGIRAPHGGYSEEYWLLGCDVV